MGRLLSVLLCSVLAALLLCFTVHGRLGCKGGLECLIDPEVAAANSANTKVPDASSKYFRGLKLSYGEGRGDLYRSDLRWVPSGPDPMHHHGSPKKPETP